MGKSKKIRSLSRTSRRESIHKDMMPKVDKRGKPFVTRRAIAIGESTVISKDIWFVVSCAEDKSVYVVDVRSAKNWPTDYVEKHPQYSLDQRQKWNQGDKHKMMVLLDGKTRYKECRFKILAVADSEAEANVILNKMDMENASLPTTHGDSVYATPKAASVKSGRKKRKRSSSSSDSTASSTTSVILDNLSQRYKKVIEKSNEIDKLLNAKDEDYVPDPKKRRNLPTSTPKILPKLDYSSGSTDLDISLSDDADYVGGKRTPTGSPSTPFNQSAIDELDKDLDKASEKEFAEDIDLDGKEIPSDNNENENEEIPNDGDTRPLETPKVDTSIENSSMHRDQENVIREGFADFAVFGLPNNINPMLVNALKVATSMAVEENFQRMFAADNNFLQNRVIPAITEVVKTTLKDIIGPVVQECLDVGLKPLLCEIKKASKVMEKTNSTSTKTLDKVARLKTSTTFCDPQLLQGNILLSSKIVLFKDGITINHDGKIFDFTKEINDSFKTLGYSPARFLRHCAAEIFGPRNLRYYRMCNKSDAIVHYNKNSLWKICPELMDIYDKIARRYIAVAMIPNESSRFNEMFRKSNLNPTEEDVAANRAAHNKQMAAFTDGVLENVYNMVKTYGGDAGRTQFKSQNIWYWRLISKGWKPRADWKLSADVIEREYLCMKRDRQNKKVTKAQYNLDYKNEELLQSDLSKNNSTKAFRYVQYFYDSCIDEDSVKNGTAELIEIMKNYNGGWPLLSNDQHVTDNIDISQFLGDIIRKYGGDYFIALTVSPDLKNTSFNRLNVYQQTSLGLGEESRDYFLNDTLYYNALNAYEEMILNFAQIIGDNIDKNAAKKQILEMVHFEKLLANILIPEEKRKNQSDTYNLWSSEKLQITVPFVNWTQLFKSILPKEVFARFKEKDFLFVVTHPDYMQNLQTILHNNSKRTVVNYIFWRFLLDRVTYLDDRFADVYQNFSREFLGTKSRMDRPNECIANTVSTFDIATGALYVRNYVKKGTKKEAIKLMDRLKEAYRQIITNLDWMDNTTKRYAIQKLKKMKANIAFPSYVFNNSLLDKQYENLTIEKTDSFFKMNQLVFMSYQNKIFYDILKPVIRDEFDSTAADVDAWNLRDRNILRVPAGILQYPFFDPELPNYVNYGDIGTIIGHEITHGFDDEGAQYYEYGNLYNWWTEKSFKQFLEKVQCQIDKYNSFRVENITNHHAYQIYIAKLGYKEIALPELQQYTNNQMFFINFAYFYCENRNSESSLQQILSDEHSPHIFRVNGVLENSVEFAQTFNCAKGSKMNPKNEKCVIW